jgi:hypothetical protein
MDFRLMRDELFDAVKKVSKAERTHGYSGMPPIPAPAYVREAREEFTKLLDNTFRNLASAFEAQVSLRRNQADTILKAWNDRDAFVMAATSLEAKVKELQERNDKQALTIQAVLNAVLKEVA